MRNQRVYDLPVRTFHWVFAGLFVIAFTITKVIDDDSPAFSIHMLAGILLVSSVLLRLIWGFLGTKHSRFASFALSPKDLINYFKGLLSGDKRKWAGHNPASSWATLAMFALALGLGATGFLMTTGEEETFKEIHELLANGFLVVVLLHVAGVLLHGFRHRDGIALSMLDGAKSEVPIEETISETRPLVGVLFGLFILGFGAYLARNFDYPNRTLNFFGTTLQLGETENEGQGGGEHDEEDDD